MPTRTRPLADDEKPTSTHQRPQSEPEQTIPERPSHRGAITADRASQRGPIGASPAGAVPAIVAPPNRGAGANPNAAGQRPTGALPASQRAAIPSIVNRGASVAQQSRPSGARAPMQSTAAHAPTGTDRPSRAGSRPALLETDIASGVIVAQPARTVRRPDSRATTERRPERLARGTSPPPDQLTPPEHARSGRAPEHARSGRAPEHAHGAAEHARAAAEHAHAAAERGHAAVFDQLLPLPAPDLLARGTSPNDALEDSAYESIETDVHTAQNDADDPLVAVLNALSPPSESIDTEPFQRAQPATPPTSGPQMPTMIVVPSTEQTTRPERRSTPSVENHVVRTAWDPEHTSSTEQQLLHYKPHDQMWLGSVVSAPQVGAALVIGRFMQPDFTVTSPVTKIITRHDGVLVQTTSKNRYFVENNGATYLVRRVG